MSVSVAVCYFRTCIAPDFEFLLRADPPVSTAVRMRNFNELVYVDRSWKNAPKRQEFGYKKIQLQMKGVERQKNRVQ